jgi:hypothetical protein
MSVKKLEGMLNKLLKTEKELKKTSEGGFIGMGNESTKTLEKAGGSKKRRGGNIKDFSGGNIKDFSGGNIKDFSGGNIKDFSGGNIKDFSGSGLTGGKKAKTKKTKTKTKKPKCSNCGYVKCRCGNDMTNCIIADLTDLMGGDIANFSGGVLLPNVSCGGMLEGGSTTTGGRMRSDYRSYNSSTTQRGSGKNYELSANLPYGYNAIDAGVQGGAKKRKSKGTTDHLSQWREYLNAYRVEHPNLSMKEAMKKASVDYKKR